MAGKVKNYYVTIIENGGKKEVIRTKVFFTSGEANKFLTEMKEKYPSPAFTVMREYY